jgi:hypothetical protein
MYYQCEELATTALGIGRGDRIPNGEKRLNLIVSNVSMGSRHQHRGKRRNNLPASA